MPKTTRPEHEQIPDDESELLVTEPDEPNPYTGDEPAVQDVIR